MTFDPKSLSYTKFHKRRKYWKGRYILAHFNNFFWVPLLFTFLQFSQKCARLYRPIQSVGLFFVEIFGISNFKIYYFFLQLLVKFNYSVISIATNLNIYKFYKKKFLSIWIFEEPREQHLSDVRQKKIELHKIS